MKIRMALISLVLHGCGTDTSAQQTGTTVTPSKTDNIQPAEAAPDTKTVVTEYKKTEGGMAIALDDTKDLPTCSLANDKQLAYIKKDDAFYTCDAQTWVLVPVAKSSPGAAGKDGAKGDKGDKGDDGRPSLPNQWLDPVTSVLWNIGSVQNLSEFNFNFTHLCTSGWRLPTSDEVAAAYLHGIGATARELNAQATGLWSNAALIDAQGATVRTYYDEQGRQREGGMLGADPAIACVKGAL